MAEENKPTSSDRVYKVVVTGFGPFQNVPENESWLAVSGLWSEPPLPQSIRLVTRELPVVYDIVKREVNTLWETENPDVRNLKKFIFQVGFYFET
jgi:pyrrolidone-carboxylate peptidase